MIPERTRGRARRVADPGSGTPGDFSSTMKDLAVGSTLRFIDRGEQQLKGVPDPWRLYAVTE